MRSAKTYLNIRLLSSFASELARQRYLSLQKRARKRSRLWARAARWKIATCKTSPSNLSQIMIFKEKGIQGYSTLRWCNQTSSQLNPDRDKIYHSGQPFLQRLVLVKPILRSNSNLEHKIHINPRPNSSQNCCGKNFLSFRSLPTSVTALLQFLIPIHQLSNWGQICHRWIRLIPKQPMTNGSLLLILVMDSTHLLLWARGGNFLYKSASSSWRFRHDMELERP